MNLFSTAISRRLKGQVARTCFMLCLSVDLLCQTGCAFLNDGPPLPLAKVDMQHMYGGWYLVATCCNWFEKGIVAPYEIFSPRPDGDIQDDFYFKKGSFDGETKHFVTHDWVRPDTDNAYWRVQIVWPIDLPFLVLYTSPDYGLVMFGERNRKLGWIYSRTAMISEAQYQDALERFAALGFDTSNFVKFIQAPEQIGRPGYWSDEIQSRR